jgi:hypothetical protein
VGIGTWSPDPIVRSTNDDADDLVRHTHAAAARQQIDSDELVARSNQSEPDQADALARGTAGRAALCGSDWKSACLALGSDP